MTAPQSYIWSSADRLSQRGADTFAYDALDRLTSSTVSGTSRTYAYDGDGLLATRTQGTTTSFLWDPSSAPQRLLQAGSDRLIYGLAPLYLVRSDGTTLTYARDGLKSVRAEVNAAGSVSGSFRYRVYGDLAQSSGAGPTLLAYAGQLRDPSGLYYLRARWYDPTPSRFLSRDPVSGDALTPGTLNAYNYGLANPAVFSDPSGMCIPLCLAAAIPLVGAISAGEAISFAAALTAGVFFARQRCPLRDEGVELSAGRCGRRRDPAESKLGRRSDAA